MCSPTHISKFEHKAFRDDSGHNGSLTSSEDDDGDGCCDGNGGGRTMQVCEPQRLSILGHLDYVMLEKIIRSGNLLHLCPHASWGYDSQLWIPWTW